MQLEEAKPNDIWKLALKHAMETKVELELRIESMSSFCNLLSFFASNSDLICDLEVAELEIVVPKEADKSQVMSLFSFMEKLKKVGLNSDLTS